MTTKNYRYQGTGLSLPNAYVGPGEVIPVETNDQGMITDPVMAPFADMLYVTDASPTVDYDRNNLNRTADDLPQGTSDDNVAVAPAGRDAQFRPVVDSSATAETEDSQTERSANSGSGSADPSADTPSETPTNDSPESDTSEGATNAPATADGATGEEPNLSNTDLDDIKGDRDALRGLARQYDDVNGRSSNDEIYQALKEKKEGNTDDGSE